MKICDWSKCTACMACINSCPTDSIKMAIDDYGREYMNVDENKCVHCNKCKNVCHAVCFEQFNMVKSAFAAIAKKEEECKTSSSGGVASVLAKNFLDGEGVVYATCYTGDSVNVNRFSSIDEIGRIKGSKYVVSYMNYTLNKVNKDIQSGKNVLFIGTPCQCASLRKNIKSDRLYLVDLICHGVPPQAYMFEYLRYFINKHSVSGNIKNIFFREGNSYSFGIVCDDETIKKEKINDSYYLKGFMKALFFRECCYGCLYSKSERVGDITIGDFWGLKEVVNKNLKQNNGVSLVMVNTEQGINLWNDINEQLFFEERSINEAIENNDQLRRPSCKHKNHERFLRLYKTNKFVKAAKKCIWFDMLKSKTRERLMRLLCKKS